MFKKPIPQWTQQVSYVTKKDKELLSKNATVVEISPGEVLCRQGEVPRQVFLLLEGNVKVRKNDQEIAQLGPNSILGELSIANRQPYRSADVISEGASTVAAISLREFYTLCAKSPSFAAWVDENVATRS